MNLMNTCWGCFGVRARKEKPGGLDLSPLPLDLRLVILAHLYAEKISTNVPNIWQWRKIGKIPLPFDYFLQVVVAADHTISFESQRLKRDFVNLFAISESELSKHLPGLNIIKTHIKDKLIRQHVESFLICKLCKQSPFDIMSALGQTRLYYSIVTMLSELVVCEDKSDTWLHYFTIEYVPSHARLPRRKIKLFANWELELFKFQMIAGDKIQVVFDVFDFQLKPARAPLFPDILLLFKNFTDHLGILYGMRFLNEGLLGSDKLESI